MPMQIVFDKACYTPGTVVTGNVIVIKRKNSEKVKGLTLTYKGRSKTMIGYSDGVATYKEDIYFNEKIDLFGHDGTNMKIPGGENFYPFKFELPAGLPSSFECDFGNVQYIVAAKLTRSSWREDKNATMRLPVEEIFDLNLDPLAPAPAEIRHHKYVKHFWPKTGPYGIQFKIPRSGFLRGHSIPFYVEIKNYSKLDLKKIKVSILQEVQSDVYSTITRSIVEETKGPAVPAGQIQVWTSRLKIPYGVPPTNLGNVLNYPSVIPVQYCLQVQLGLKSSSEESITGKIPIIIGTISLLSRPRVISSNCAVHRHLTNRNHSTNFDLSQSQFSPNLQLNERALRPVRRYEYYLEFEEENNYERVDENNCRYGRYGRSNQIAPDSPPPSYDEVFTYPVEPTEDIHETNNTTSNSTQSHYPDLKLKLFNDTSNEEEQDGRRTTEF